MAEESKQSGLENDDSKSNRSTSNTSLDENIPDLEESLDFDMYLDDIPLITEESSDISQSIDDASIKNIIHFSDSGSTEQIPLNLSSFQEADSNDYSELESKPFSEDDLDNILLKDETEFGDDEPIALSTNELDRITSENEDYSDDYTDSSDDNSSYESNDLDDTYDTELEDEDNITLGKDELDNILNPDEEYEEEDESDTRSFFDSDEEEESEEEQIALSPDELNNITDSEYSETDTFDTEDIVSDPPADLFDETPTDEEIALSGDELNNLLESGNIEEEDTDGESKSFFDSEEEEEAIALSPDELSNITNTEYQGDDGIQTEDLSSGIESNEFGVSTESVFDEQAEEEDIALSSDELDNILETGEIEFEEEPEEDMDSENAKSFFDSEDSEEDESISLSADELGNITAEDDSDSDIESEDTFDIPEENEDLETNAEANIFEDSNDTDDEIALSGDELNNLLESGDIQEEEDPNLGTSFFEEESEDESISLSADELGNITAEEDIEIENSEIDEEFQMDSPKDMFDESEDSEEEIALSGDELNNLLESGEIQEEEDMSTESSLFEGDIEDESIALSADELGNITAEQDTDELSEDFVSQEDDYKFPESTEEEFSLESTTGDIFGQSEESDTNEEIALSGDELNDILQSGDVIEEESEFNNPIDSGMVIGDNDDYVIDDNSSLSDLGDFNPDIETSSEEENDFLTQEESFQFGSVKKEDLKKVISYMDELLGSLPDSYIKEFASSEYFDLYKKIMKELEL